MPRRVLNVSPNHQGAPPVPGRVEKLAAAPHPIGEAVLAPVAGALPKGVNMPVSRENKPHAVTPAQESPAAEPGIRSPTLEMASQPSQPGAGRPAARPLDAGPERRGARAG